MAADRLNLSDHNMFKIVRENLRVSTGVETNIIAYRNDILYAWNAKDSCILTLGLKPFFRGGITSKYQIVRPSQVPFESVVEIVVSDLGLQVALITENGVYVVDMPKRWGCDSEYEGGKASMTQVCRIMQSGTFERVLQARWHPGSTDDNHLVVLYRDNNLRVYHTDTGHAVQTVPLGGSFHHHHRKRGYALFTDYPVAFDFTPPTLRKIKKRDGIKIEEVVWPILVLFGNGDVYHVIISLFEDILSDPVVCGPILMFPSADDNYGSDASAILVMHTCPPVVAISTCSGTIYHAVMFDCFEEIDDEYDTAGIWDCPIPLTDKRVVMYVFELLELELGLSLQDDKDDSEVYTCPIRLMRDENFYGRYMCVHNAGIHLVTVPFILQLQAYMVGSTDELEAYISRVADYPSSPRYIVCTRIKNTNIVLPPVGVCIIPSPDTVVVLLTSGEVLSLHLPFVNVSVASVPRVNTSKATGIPDGKENFEKYIKYILTPAGNIPMRPPVLRIDPKRGATTKDVFEDDFMVPGTSMVPPGYRDLVTTRAMMYYRNEILPRHEAAIDELEKRLKAAYSQKEQQQTEVTQLEMIRIDLRTKAEQVAEKYEFINDKQQYMITRSEKLLLKVRSQSDEMTAAEIKMMDELKDFQVKAGETTNNLEAIRKRIESVRHLVMYVSPYEEQLPRAEMNEKRTNVAKDILREVAIEVSRVKNRMKYIKTILQYPY